MDIEKVIELRNSKKELEAKKLMEKLILKEPDNPYYNYQMAWCNDVLGNEREAIPYYIKAINLKLNENDLLGAYIGLGSTYRAIGDYNKAKNVFEEAIEKFLDSNVLKTFYSIVLYNLKEYNKSTSLLLKILIKTNNDEEVISFSKALDFYSDNLDKTFG